MRYGVCDAMGWHTVRYYGPDFQLHIQPSNMENLNTQEYLERSVQSSVRNHCALRVQRRLPIHSVASIAAHH